MKRQKVWMESLVADSGWPSLLSHRTQYPCARYWGASRSHGSTKGHRSLGWTTAVVSSEGLSNWKAHDHNWAQKEESYRSPRGFRFKVTAQVVKHLRSQTAAVFAAQTWSYSMKKALSKGQAEVYRRQTLHLRCLHWSNYRRQRGAPFRP